MPRGPMSEEHKRKIGEAKKAYWAAKKANVADEPKSKKRIAVNGDAKDIAREELMRLALVAVKEGDKELAEVWLNAAAGIE